MPNQKQFRLLYIPLRQFGLGVGFFTDLFLKRHGGFLWFRGPTLPFDISRFSYQGASFYKFRTNSGGDRFVHELDLIPAQVQREVHSFWSKS